MATSDSIFNMSFNIKEAKDQRGNNLKKLNEKYGFSIFIRKVLNNKVFHSLKGRNLPGRSIENKLN